jgi:hypothetical protein
MNAYSDTSYPACKSETMRPALLSSLRTILNKYPGSAVGPISVTVTPHVAIDGVRSYTVSEAYTIHGPSNSGVGRVTEDVVHLQKGPVITQLTVNNLNEGPGTFSFPTALPDQLTKVLSARLG